MPGRLRNRVFKSSTLSFVREGLRSSTVSLWDIAHGYAYARWPYLYIGSGLGETRLARVAGPVLSRVQRILPVPTHPTGETGTFADGYHGKVISLDTAKKLVSVRRDIEITNLEHVVPFEKARGIILHDPDHIAVLDCPCRASREKPCLPLDVCLIVGEPFASFVLEHHPERSRAITSAEAVAILEAEHERGPCAPRLFQGRDAGPLLCHLQLLRLLLRSHAIHA
ncbi:MAG: hypothetical protein J5I90_14310 [Caldilineales bacterium]|nr:hypothetical protein [Caldilineales bacterium]